MAHDPTIYRGAAAYYARGRPPYSRELRRTLAGELGLDGAGRLLVVGTGPGVLAIELAPLFEETVALDQDADMLAEGARLAAEAGAGGIRWVHALAEQIPDPALGLGGPGTFRLVTFGQSFYWTDPERVPQARHDLLPPGRPLAAAVP